MTNLKHIAATLAILGSASFAVTGCNKNKEATEVPEATTPAEGEATPAEATPEATPAEGEASCGGEKKAEGEASCGGEKKAEGEASCGGAK